MTTSGTLSFSKFIVEAAVSQLLLTRSFGTCELMRSRTKKVRITDSLKPVLDDIIAKIVGNLSGRDKEFYIKEFDFFNKVTGISGKLKPLIEQKLKKQAIDEELRLMLKSESTFPATRKAWLLTLIIRLVDRFRATPRPRLWQHSRCARMPTKARHSRMWRPGGWSYVSCLRGSVAVGNFQSWR